jgi:hypothetical protein
MPYENLQDGLYLLRQAAQKPGIHHYGILDVGNRICHPQVRGGQPVVIHQTPPTIRIDWLQNTGQWEIHLRITDEEEAIRRINQAFTTPTYNFFGNNCEHFARYVATGVRESTQLQSASFVAGLVALVWIAND